MKTSGIIVTILLVVLALGLTVWIGRYQAKTDVLMPTTAPAPVDPGPEVSKTGPFPKAVAEVTEHNFGVMALHQTGEHKFVIKNEGQAELQLVARKEDATCQCTLGKLADGDTIPPGESREVTLNWEIKVMVESFRHSAKIRTNDPENRIIEFVVTGRIDQRFIVSPGDTWEVGELSPTEPTKVEGTIHSRTVDELKIQSVKTTNDKVSVTYDPMTTEELTEKGAKCGYHVRAVVAPGVPIGPFSEKVTLLSEDDERKEFDIQLKGYLAGPIEFLGPAYRKETSVVAMGEFPSDTGKDVTLSLFVRDFDQDLELLDVVPKSDRVQFELKKDEKLKGKARRYQLKVKALPGPHVDFLTGPALKFELKFNHPNAESVVLKVRMLAI